MKKKWCPGCYTEMKRVHLFQDAAMQIEQPFMKVSNDDFKTSKNYDLYECPNCGLTLYWRDKDHE